MRHRKDNHIRNSSVPPNQVSRLSYVPIHVGTFSFSDFMRGYAAEQKNTMHILFVGEGIYAELQGRVNQWLFETDQWSYTISYRPQPAYALDCIAESGRRRPVDLIIIDRCFIRSVEEMEHAAHSTNKDALVLCLWPAPHQETLPGAIRDALSVIIGRLKNRKK